MLLISSPFFFAVGQEKCGLLADGKTHSPVAYASIYYPTTSTGMFSSENGVYCLPSSINLTDSVVISALGYDKTTIAFTDLLKKDTIYLNNRPINLENVVIKAKSSAYISKEIGYSKKPFIELEQNSITPNSNTKIVTYIPNDSKKTSFISKIHCRLYPEENSLATTFRLRLRLYTHNGLNYLPAQDILNENVIIDVSTKQKMVEFEVGKYNIETPANGFWIGVESMGYTDKNNVYWPIKDHEFGKFKFKNTKKFKLESIEPISPSYMYKIIKSNQENSVSANWNNKWSPYRFKRGITFLFGAVVQYAE